MAAVKQEQNLDGIRGWLILFLITLLVSPIRICLFLYRNFVPLFSDGSFERLTTPTSDVYHPLWMPLLTFEIVCNCLIIVFGLFVLFYLIRKSKKTPKLAIAWLILGFIFVVGDYFFADMIPLIAAQPEDPETIKEVARSTIGAVIWVPYFLVSKRVKATFTR